VKLIKQKQKVFKKYENVRHPAYTKAARAASTEIRRAKRNFEKKLADNIDSDRKSFYAYARNRSIVRSTVRPLLDDQLCVPLQHLRILLSHLIYLFCISVYCTV